MNAHDMALLAEILVAPDLIDINNDIDVQENIDAFKRLGVRVGAA